MKTSKWWDSPNVDVIQNAGLGCHLYLLNGAGLRHHPSVSLSQSVSDSPNVSLSHIYPFIHLLSLPVLSACSLGGRNLSKRLSGIKNPALNTWQGWNEHTHSHMIFQQQSFCSRLLGLLVKTQRPALCPAVPSINTHTDTQWWPNEQIQVWPEDWLEIHVPHPQIYWIYISVTQSKLCYTFLMMFYNDTFNLLLFIDLHDRPDSLFFCWTCMSSVWYSIHICSVQCALPWRSNKQTISRKPQNGCNGNCLATVHQLKVPLEVITCDQITQNAS